MAVSEIIPAEEGRGLYRALAFRRILVICGLIVALAFSFSLDLALGPARYPLSEVLSALVNPSGADLQTRVVLWDIRMPIALMAITVGACLSLAMPML